MYNTPVKWLGYFCMRIAFFDSGVGGLTVLAAARQLEPDHEYIYYADSEHAPYGEKSAAAVRKRVVECTDFLISQGIDALVIACNTATAVCIEELRQRYSVPVIGMEPALKPALEGSAKGRVLVLATSLTLQEGKLESLLQKLDSHSRVDRQSMDKLVELAELNYFDSPVVDEYLQNQLSSYKSTHYDAVVLGCTHFIYFKEAISRFFDGQVRVIDGNGGTVRHLFSQLNGSLSGPPGLKIFRSGYSLPETTYDSLLHRLTDASITRPAN